MLYQEIKYQTIHNTFEPLLTYSQNGNHGTAGEKANAEKCGIGALQRKVSQLSNLITFLESGELPHDPKLAKRKVLEQGQYDLMDNVLHHENPVNPGCWRQVDPSALQAILLQLLQSHGGKFSRHLAEKKTIL